MQPAKIAPKDRLIVPLDLPSVAAAEAMIVRLGDSVSFYKIGYQLAYAGGLPLVRQLADAGKKVFVMFSNNHHNDGHIAVVLPAPIGVQQALIEASPGKYYKPPYVGGAGWIGVEVPRVSDKALTMHIQEAWRLLAPQKLKDAAELIS